MQLKLILTGVLTALVAFSVAAPTPDNGGVAEFDTKTPPGSRSPSPSRSPFQSMIDDVVKDGGKITADAVVNMWPINNAAIPGLKPTTHYAWLEKGNDKAGMAHIMKEHGTDFANRGISEKDIPRLAQEATTHGTIAGYQGKGTGRPIFETTFNGKKEYVGVTMGNNGFIVGMNPSSASAITKKGGKK